MLKVLYIGHGLEPFSKGGAIFYQNSLIKGIRDRGCEVVVFISAPRYTVKNKPFLKIWYNEGIKFIELYNPPYKLGYQNDPLVQCRFPIIETMIKKILINEKPDIVHIHELQFFPASIIDVIANFGIASIKTIHNYYDICPQRDLFYNNKKSCQFFPSTSHCAECLSNRPVARNEKYNVREIKHRIKKFIPGFILRRYKKLKTKPKYTNKYPKINTSIILPYANQKYNYRQKFFIKRLNKLDLIHCSSHRLKEIFCQAGVLNKKIRVISLSNPNITNISPKPIRENKYPVVFGYAGGEYTHKGYHVLLKAFSKLDQNKSKLIMWQVKQSKWIKNYNIEIREKYKPKEINKAFEDIDVGVVPSIWEEAFGMIGIEFLTAKIPVIGSKVGGIPDWLKDKKNGFLVCPGDTDDLVKKMNMFISKPELIAKFQKQTKPWKSFSDHIDEILQVYKEIKKEKQIRKLKA